MFVIFFLIFVILTFNGPVEKKSVDGVEVNSMVADLMRLRILENAWSHNGEYDFIYIREKLSTMNFSHEKGKIVYKNDLKKFVYKNSALTQQKKEALISRTEDLKCRYKICFFN